MVYMKSTVLREGYRWSQLVSVQVDNGAAMVAPYLNTCLVPDDAPKITFREQGAAGDYRPNRDSIWSIGWYGRVDEDSIEDRVAERGRRIEDQESGHTGHRAYIWPPP